MDNIKKIKLKKRIFVKILSILDTNYILLNNYSTRINRNHLLPSNYTYNTCNKINDFNNSTYIDVFFSHIVSELYIHKKSPSFPICYGSVNGISDYKLDITDEYSELMHNKSFRNNIGRQFYINFYSDSSSDSDYYSDSSSDSSSNSSSDSEYINNIIAIIKNIPIILKKSDLSIVKKETLKIK